MELVEILVFKYLNFFWKKKP